MNPVIKHLSHSMLLAVRYGLCAAAIVAGIIGAMRICLPAVRHAETFPAIVARSP